MKICIRYLFWTVDFRQFRLSPLQFENIDWDVGDEWVYLTYPKEINGNLIWYVLRLFEVFRCVWNWRNSDRTKLSPLLRIGKRFAVISWLQIGRFQQLSVVHTWIWRLNLNVIRLVSNDVPLYEYTRDVYIPGAAHSTYVQISCIFL